MTRHRELDMYFHSSKHSTNDDVARLLDPAYSPAKNTYSAAAYLDNKGNLHDPDFRHFPSPAHSHTRKRRATSHSSSTFPRPSWELSFGYTDEEPVELEDDDLDHHAPHAYLPRRSPIASHRYAYSRDPFLSATKYSPSYYATPADYSPPTSCLSDDSPLSDSDSSPESSPLSDVPLPLHRRICLRANRHRSRSRDGRASADLHEEQSPPDVDDEKHTDTDRDDQEETQDDYTPTCAETMRRQWDLISLRVRFGVFRAKKRVRARLGRIKSC